VFEMDGETCIAPVPELDDWAEALKLAAEWDAAATRSRAAPDESAAADRPIDSSSC